MKVLVTACEKGREVRGRFQPASGRRGYCAMNLSGGLAYSDRPKELRSG